MKTLIVSLAAVFLACSAVLVDAADDAAAEALMKKSGCFKCHSVDKKKDGPAFQETAKKLKGNAGTPDMEAGDQVRDQLDSSTGKLESSFDDLKQSADEAADAPAGEFLQKLGALASDFAALQSEIAQTVTSIENADVGAQAKAELQQAFADAPACQSLQAQS
jgi:hypothetical protein